MCARDFACVVRARICLCCVNEILLTHCVILLVMCVRYFGCALCGFACVVSVRFCVVLCVRDFALRFACVFLLCVLRARFACTVHMFDL